MFALSRSVAAQTATLASVRLFASRLYFVLFLLPIVVKVFISMRAHIFFSVAAKKSLFHFYSREILYLPSARLSVSLARSRPLSISRVGGGVFRPIARADSLMLFLSASLTLFFPRIKTESSIEIHHQTLLLLEKSFDFVQSERRGERRRRFRPSSRFIAISTGR